MESVGDTEALVDGDVVVECEALPHPDEDMLDDMEYVSE